MQDFMNYEGSPEETRVRAYLASLEIDYDAITKDKFVTLMDILNKSKKLQSKQSIQRGKTIPQLSLFDASRVSVKTEGENDL